MILDTSSVIARVRKGLEIRENTTSITLIEFPPLRRYEKFRGVVYFLTLEDQLKASIIQERLRTIGKPMSAADLLIAAICLNRNEELLTMDEDFLSIRDVEHSFRVTVERTKM